MMKKDIKSTTLTERLKKFIRRLWTQWIKRPIERLYNYYHNMSIAYKIVSVVVFIFLVVGLFLVCEFNLNDNPELFRLGITLIIISFILIIKKCIEFLYSFYNTSIVYNIILFIVLTLPAVLVFEFNLKDPVTLPKDPATTTFLKDLATFIKDPATLFVLLITAIISFMLMLEQHRVAEAQEKSNTEQRYNNAISQIESEIEGVVQIGFQNLYELALEEESDNKKDNIRKVFTDYLKQKSRASKKNVKNAVSPGTVVFILKRLIKTK